VFSFGFRKLIWLSDADVAKGYAVDFLSVSLHAVSRDPETYSSPCIYTQVITMFLVFVIISSLIGPGLRF